MDNTTLLYKLLSSKIEQMRFNRYIDDTSLFILIFAYALLIVCSAFGNIVVLTTLIKKPEMRTERNMYIANLAISDLVLCLFTMPFSLLEIVAKYWPLGEWSGLLRAKSRFINSNQIPKHFLKLFLGRLSAEKPFEINTKQRLYTQVSFWTDRC